MNKSSKVDDGSELDVDMVEPPSNGFFCDQRADRQPAAAKPGWALATASLATHLG